MKKIVFFLLSLFVCSVHAAPIIIDPNIGLSGSFNFGGTSDIGTLQTSPADGWEITVALDSFIDVHINDQAIVGDEWALVFDGVVTPWDTSNPGAGVHFIGDLSGLFLSAGTHSFDFMLTAACCNSGSFNQYSFSAVSDVPLPTAVWFFSTGIVGLLAFRRRIKA